MAEFSPCDATFIVDTREQRPWDLESLGLSFVNAGLNTGDYSIKGYENSLTIERKSLDDIVGCCGKSRERFEKELHRMLKFTARAVVIEAPWVALEAGRWRSRIKPQSVTGSIIGWMQWGIPFFFASSEQEAAKWAVRFMLIYFKRRRKHENLRCGTKEESV